MSSNFEYMQMGPWHIFSPTSKVIGAKTNIALILFFILIYFALDVMLLIPDKGRYNLPSTFGLPLMLYHLICDLCTYGSEWHCGRATIISSYRAFSKQKINADLGVSIGLDHVNVTLQVIPRDNRTLDINFNERFNWEIPSGMREQYHTALIKGLPYPILTVAEYLAVETESFTWGRYYRSAGYYTSFLLWASFATWLLMNIMLVNVPRYGAYLMVVTGGLMCMACGVFWLLMPPKPLHIRFEEVWIDFNLGWCFWMTLVVGGIEMATGLIISILDLMFPHTFSTILEIDFDTPYDRHIIIEDSTETRKRRFKIPRLEEPLNATMTAGSRLLRRLSKRDKREETDLRPNPVPMTYSAYGSTPGFDNHAFEMEPKLPFRQNFMMRTDSKKSTKSVNFRNASTRSNHFLDIPIHQDITDKQKQFTRTDSKQSSLSAASSQISIPRSVNFDNIEDLRGNIGPSLPSSPMVHHDSHMVRQDSSQSCGSGASSYGLSGLSRASSIRKISSESAASAVSTSSNTSSSSLSPHEPIARTNSANIIVFHRTDSRGQLQKVSDQVVEIKTDDSSEMWD
ncbi:unnamed protein product, partial [Meganyctiphanes norvegica]